MAKALSDYVSENNIVAPEIEGLPAGSVEVQDKDRHINVAYRTGDGSMIEIAFYHNGGHYRTMIAPKFEGDRFVTVSVSDVVALHRDKVARYGAKSLAKYASDWLPVAKQYLELRPEILPNMLEKARRVGR